MKACVHPLSSKTWMSQENCPYNNFFKLSESQKLESKKFKLDLKKIQKKRKEEQKQLKEISE
jgi:hypothetical protein